jgi:SET domain-containing protein
MSKMPIEPPDLCVRDTGTAKGRGVFALRRFARGEVVEVAPVLVLKTDYDALPELLKTYVFDWSTLTGVPRSQAVALGYGSMYNHDNPANLQYVADARRSVMRYVAVRDIEAGEELTINYNGLGGAPEWDDDNWFERVGIDVIRTYEELSHEHD